MLKFLEKGPISRWKFIQRLMHRRRNSRRSGSDKFKTFDTTLAPKSDSTLILEHDAITHDYVEDTVPAVDEDNNTTGNRMPISSTAPEGLGTSLDTEKPIRRTKSNENITCCEIEEEPTKNKSEKTAALSLSERVSLARNNSARIKAWNESHDIEVEPLTTTEEPKTKTSSTQQNPFQRTSRFRSSLKELKKRSVNHIDNVRESMRRKVNTRKYDNLDRELTAEDEEIVDYDKSPGTRRRQVIEL